MIFIIQFSICEFSHCLCNSTEETRTLKANNKTNKQTKKTHTHTKKPQILIERDHLETDIFL